MQIMIYLLCIYLVYKGVEIFQLAFVSSNPDKKIKTAGIVIGILATAAAVFIGINAVFVTEGIVAQIGNNMPNLK